MEVGTFKFLAGAIEKIVFPPNVHDPRSSSQAGSYMVFEDGYANLNDGRVYTFSGVKVP